MVARNAQPWAKLSNAFGVPDADRSLDKNSQRGLLLIPAEKNKSMRSFPNSLFKIGARLNDSPMEAN